MAYCDLHTHSTASDGTLTPEQIIREAEKIGLSAVVLSDHNTVDGLAAFLAAEEGSCVEAVPAVEFSTQYGEKELHILGMFIRPEVYGQIAALLELQLLNKEKSNIDLIRRLAGVGVVLDYGKIKAQAGSYVNRAVIGAEMVRLGYVASVPEAFDRYLDEKIGLYVPAPRLDSYEAIRFIKSIGAVAVLAHPLLGWDGKSLRGFLPKAVEAGLDGMEVYYSKYSPETTALAEKIAGEFQLLPSGGSDFHGDNKPGIYLGVGRGDLKIPDTWLDALRSRAKII